MEIINTGNNLVIKSIRILEGDKNPIIEVSIGS